MKKIKAKILLGFGATTTLLTAGSVVLSCGNSDQDQSKLKAVTAQMIADYVKTQTGFAPSATADVPTTAPRNILTNVTLNGLSGLTITISNWVANTTLGSVTFNASISKTGLTAKSITGVTYDGWYNDQERLDAVTAQDVVDYIKTQTGFAPSDDADVPAVVPSTTLTNATLNGVSGLTITIYNWTPYYLLGSVTFDVSIAKNGLITKAIIGVTYDGWYKGSIPADQKALDLATPKIVADYVKTQTGFIPSSNLDAPTNVPSTTLTNAIINGVGGLTIAISNWTSSYFNGSVTFDVSISKPSLKTKAITGVTYDGYRTNTVINGDNLAAMENKLWSWDNTNTLKIFEGVISIETNGATKWGNHNIIDVNNIAFPNSLKTIGEYAFSGLLETTSQTITFPPFITNIQSSAFASLTSTSLKFLGAVPSASGRILNLGVNSFQNTPVTNILAGDSGTTQTEWQDWAKANCPNAFNH